MLYCLTSIWWYSVCLFGRYLTVTRATLVNSVFKFKQQTLKYISRNEQKTGLTLYEIVRHLQQFLIYTCFTFYSYINHWERIHFCQFFATLINAALAVWQKKHQPLVCAHFLLLCTCWKHQALVEHESLYSLLGQQCLYKPFTQKSEEKCYTTGTQSLKWNLSITDYKQVSQVFSLLSWWTSLNQHAITNEEGRWSRSVYYLSTGLNAAQQFPTC